MDQRGTPPRQALDNESHEGSSGDLYSPSRCPTDAEDVSLSLVMNSPRTAPDPGGDDDAQVIHLPTVIGPVRRLLGFYDDLLAGKEPPIEQLDNAVVDIKALPHIPGRLGRDLALIATGGNGASRHEIVGSIERLRQVAAIETPSSASPAASNLSSKKHAQGLQATLPGLA